MPSVTQRKLIRFGRGIAITLPKGWTDYYGLIPGDKVNVKVNSGLIITIVRKEKDSAESLAAPAESAPGPWPTARCRPARSLRPMRVLHFS